MDNNADSNIDTSSSDSAPDDRRADIASVVEQAGGDDAQSSSQPYLSGQPQPGAPVPAARAPGDTQARPGQAPASATDPTHPATTGVKPPQAWRPELRELFGQLPAPVQQQIAARERQINEALRTSNEARGFVEQFQRTTAPFEMLLRMEGGNPLKTFGDYLTTVAALRTATPGQRANRFAQLAKTFDVDIGLLDRELAAAGFGQPQGQQQQQPQPQQFRDPRVDQLIGNMQQQQQAHERQMVHEVADELAGFEERHEFVHDVREDMADLLEMAARRGVELTLDEAYRKACANNQNVSKVIAERDLHKRAAEQNKIAQRARGASLSVHGSPTVPDGVTPGNGSRRDDIEQAIAQLNGR